MDDITVTPALQTTINNAIEVRGQFAAIGNFRSTLNNGIFVFAFTIPLGWLIDYLRLIHRGVVIAQAQTAIHATFTGLIDSPERELSPDELEQLAALLLAHYDSVTHTYDFYGIITSEDFPDANTPLGIALRRAAINRLIAEIQLYVSESFVIDNIEQMADEAVDASFVDLLRIWQILLDCGNCNANEFDGVDDAQNLQHIANLAFVTDDTLPTPLLYAPNVETALQAILVPAIQLAVGTAITDTTYTLNAAAITISRLAAINVTLQAYAPNYTLAAIIAALDTENIPEVEAPLRTKWIETKFAALRTALHTNPSENPPSGTSFTDYRTAIENAYDVSFTKETNADEWGLVSIHFIRLGLDATSNAFASWLTDYIETNNAGAFVINRFEIFRRAMGSLTFRNSYSVRENFALSGESTVTVYRRPEMIDYWVYPDATEPNVTHYVPQVLDYPNNTPNSQPPEFMPGTSGHFITKHAQFIDNMYTPQRATSAEADGVIIRAVNPERQAVMSPNNFIHELGHVIDNRAGFGYQKLGSLSRKADEVDGTTGYLNLTNAWQRYGMGEWYLRATFYEYAHIGNDGNNVALYVPFKTNPSEADPESYLLHDLFDDNYALWNSDYNLYGGNTRIDTFVHNNAQSWGEAVADGFLSWVRGAFQLVESAGVSWQDFFDDHMGLFLRNAAIYTMGMVQHYQEIGNIPALELQTVSKSANSVIVRQSPNSTTSLNVLYNSQSSNLSSSFSIYGLINVDPGDGRRYWILVGDGSNRLVWMSSSASTISDDLLDSIYTVNFDSDLISPDRIFGESSEDLELILGMNLE